MATSRSVFYKIDTSLRQSPATVSSTPASCIIPTNQIFSGTYKVKAVWIPVTNFNVTTHNQNIYFTDTAAHTVQLLPGIYTSANLPALLAAGMNAVGTGTYSVTISSLTNQMTITNSTQTFSLTLGTNQTNSAAGLLGFPNLNSSVAALTQTGSNFVNLQPSKMFNFTINNTGGNGIVEPVSLKTNSFSIPITANTGSIEYYESESIDYYVRFDTPSSLISVVVKDDLGNIMNLTSDWYFILQQVC